MAKQRSTVAMICNLCTNLPDKRNMCVCVPRPLRRNTHPVVLPCLRHGSPEPLSWRQGLHTTPVVNPSQLVVTTRYAGASVSTRTIWNDSVNLPISYHIPYQVFCQSKGLCCGINHHATQVGFAVSGSAGCDGLRSDTFQIMVPNLAQTSVTNLSCIFFHSPHP